MTCFFCRGCAHPASGCEYSARVVACGPCVREFWAWFIPWANGKGARKGVLFYEHNQKHQAQI